MNLNFTFYANKFLVVGPGTVKNIVKSLPTEVRPNFKRPMIITDDFLWKSGLVDNMYNSLKQSYDGIQVYHSVLPDPPVHCIKDALNLAKENGCDSVVGIGGGSPMDVAKVVSYLLKNPHKQLDEIYGAENCPGERVPLVLIPTTSGTGSEATSIAIIKCSEKEKKAVVSNNLLPDLTIQDAELTLNQPKNITAATSLDAMVHAIESYTGKLRKNEYSDMLAQRALYLMGKNIREICQENNGKNYEARSAMLYGSFLAGQAFNNSPVSGIHALAYPVGLNFNVPHGLSNSQMMPHVMKYNALNSSSHYAELANLIIPGVKIGKTDEETTENLIQGIEDLVTDFGIESKLREVGVKETDIEKQAKDSMLQVRLLPHNPREIKYEDALQLYKNAY